MDCKLIGNVFQALEVTLAPREVFYAERGAMIYMDSGIEQDVQMNGTGLMGVLSTKFSGESLFLTKFTNMSNSSRKLTLSGQSGSLSHIKITGDSTVFFDCVDSLITRDLTPGEEIIVDENHIKALLGVDDSRISVQRNTNIIKNLVSGEGWLLTCITGPGKVFLSSVPSIAPRQQPI